MDGTKPTRRRVDTARSLRNKTLGIAPSPSRHGLKLDLAAFNAWLAEMGKVSNADIAAYLDIGEGTVSRIRNGGEIGAPVVSAITKQIRRSRKYRLQDFLIPLGDTAPEAAA